MDLAETFHCSVYQYFGVENTSCFLGNIFVFVIKTVGYCIVQVICWLEINVSIFVDKLCVLLDLQSDLLIKQWTDISSAFFLGHRRKTIYCHYHVNFRRCVDYELVRYSRPMPGYQDTATVKIELDLNTSAARSDK